jgi:fimbrial chaperone protein
MQLARRHLAIYGLAMWLAGAGAASAGSFAVSPVRATLSAARGTGSLTVHNNGTEAAVVQLSVVAWSQESGQDVYQPSKDVLATPPLFTVQPGASQVVRVGLRRAPDATRELSYRLYLQEVPPPPKADFTGLQVALRLSVPVFVTPAKANAKPVLHWRLSRAPGGGLTLAADNNGSVHVQVANFSLADANGKALASRQVAAYLLPNQGRAWQLALEPLPAAGTKLQLAAQTDAGDLKSDVTVEQP